VVCTLGHVVNAISGCTQTRARAQPERELCSVAGVGSAILGAGVATGAATKERTTTAATKERTTTTAAG
jgi:hypothetical protein